MHDAGRLDHACLLETEIPNVLEEPFPVAQQKRHDVQLQLLDEAGREYCCTASAPPAINTSRSPATSRACSSAEAIPSVTKWNVVPPCIGSGARGWCVSTNTGVWYGGSSPTSRSRGIVAPGAVAAAEHVSAHHGGADVLRLLDHLRARVGVATLQALRSSPGLEVEHPSMQFHATHAERIVQALARARDVAVKRDRQLTFDLPHIVLPLAGKVQAGPSRQLRQLTMSDVDTLPTKRSPLRRIARALVAVAMLLVVAAASIAFALQVTPERSVTSFGQTVTVGTAPPTWSTEGPGQVVLFGFTLPTQVRFIGPVRPRLTLTDISINEQVAGLFSPGPHAPVADTLGAALERGWRSYFLFEIGFVALGATLLLGAIAGWRRFSTKKTDPADRGRPRCSWRRSTSARSW